MLRIAVVDDEPDLLDFVQEVFDERGWETTVFRSGTAALTEVTHNPPDVLILDLRLGGGISGWDMVEDLQTHQNTRDVPVIVWSAAERELQGKQEWLRERGITALPKPCEIDELYTAVDAALTDKLARSHQRT